MLPELSAALSYPYGLNIGIIGGGQLGRMLAMEAARMGFRAHIFTPEADSPAEEVAFRTIIADYADEAALTAFADSVDVVTVEFENIPVETASQLSRLKPFFPSPDLFAICQHRRKEKDFVRQCGFGTADYQIAKNADSLKQAVLHLGTPCIAKTVTLGYDGKGQVVIHHADESESAWKALNVAEVIVEAFVPFVEEASILVCRDQHGNIQTFPVALNKHRQGILRQSKVPSGFAEEILRQMQQLARHIAEASKLVGLLAIECFILQDTRVLVNEMAPRPHNSGHWTMNGCSISQFEQLLRVCAGLPLQEPVILYPTEMENILGDNMSQLNAWAAQPNTYIHLYGKAEARQGRKMGHVNIIHPQSQSYDKKT